jgi:tetratricopeptide (TPR) repeat protein
MILFAAIGPASDKTTANRFSTNRSVSTQRGAVALGLALAVATSVVFWPCTHNGLVYDDEAMIGEGSFVQGGVTSDNLRRAFTSVEAAHWHPLVWISFEVEYALGLGPRGFHATNVVLHAINVWLLYQILWSMTGKMWRSGFAAALFAIHPLHAESVAWIVERKDVLSTLFWLLATWAYAGYSHAPSRIKMAGVAALMAMGLMAKSMLVTLPLTLLVLDWWPLGRVPNSPERSEPARTISWRDAIGEKLLLFGLAIGGALVQIWAQHVRGKNEAIVPWALRIENAMVAPVVYLRKMIWPVDLAAFYPYQPNGYATWYVVLCGLILSGLTLISLGVRRTRPYLVAGWLWYLITLAPVSGIFQVVGGHAYADRYTYVPMIGIALMVSWTVADSAATAVKPVMVATCVTWLLSLAWITNHQIATWRDDLRLWQRAVAVTQNNYFAFNNLGVALEKDHQYQAASENYYRSIAAKPTMGLPHNNLGRVMEKTGRLADAELEYRKATDIDPQNADAWRNLARLLGMRGRWHEAVDAGRRARDLKPRNAEIRLSGGMDLLHAGSFPEAQRELELALRINPQLAQAWYYLGTVQMIEGQATQAYDSLSHAVDIKREPVYFYALAQVLRQLNRVQDANQLFERARKTDAGWIKIANDLAWTMSTSSDDSTRNGRYALWLATQICQTVDEKNAESLETLAAAQAEVGDFAAAKATLTDWLVRFGPQASSQRRSVIERELKGYDRLEPWRAVNGK